MSKWNELSEAYGGANHDPVLQNMSAQLYERFVNTDEMEDPVYDLADSVIICDMDSRETFVEGFQLALKANGRPIQVIYYDEDTLYFIGTVAEVQAKFDSITVSRPQEK